MARTSWPVSTGVPFPRGVLREATTIAVKTSKGSALPVQTRVLSRWDDGSVRWLLADVAVTIAAHDTAKLTVTANGAASPASRSRMQVVEGSDGVAIDTGPLQFTVPRTTFAILDDIRLHGHPLRAGPLRAFMTLDQRIEPRPPRAVTVRENGPLRAQIEMRGQLAPGFDYLVRVHAYAGQPFVRIFFTFVATGPAETTAVRQLAITSALPASTYRLGLEHAPSTGRVPKAGVKLIQLDNQVFRLNGKRHQGHAAGWVEASGASGGMGIASRFFWQEYPQSFEVMPTTLTYNMWAPSAVPAQIGVGAAKTHEFVVNFFDTMPPAETAAALAEPLTAQIDPLWSAATAALPNAIAPGKDTDAFLHRLNNALPDVESHTAAERWDEAAHGDCPPAGSERVRIGAFGMLNWGDWNYPGLHDTTKGCDAWGNLEYDLTQVAALAFAATGAATYHELMTAAARHFMDVDVIHAQPQQPKWIGMNHPKNPLHFSFAHSGVDLGHTWTEGLISYFYLTGDDRALDTARGIADYLVRRLQAGVVRGNPRQWGWPVIALLAVSQATGEPRYLTAARDYAQRGMKAFAPTDLSSWKIGILADALANTHAATRDADIEQWLRTYAGAVAAKPDGDLRLYPAVAYVAALTHDARLAASARAAADRIQFGSWAKPFTIAGRTGFRILSLLEAESAKSKAESQMHR